MVAALVQPYKTRTEAEQGIADSLREDYPEAAQSERIVKVAQEIYRENFFPEVKTDWRSHPDFVGHKNWNGCFRCHDGKHVTADGKMSIKASDCRSCHLILAQGAATHLIRLMRKVTISCISTRLISDFSCIDCHTGGLQK